jgi:predicted Zn-dependent protease with MMP-like domain
MTRSKNGDPSAGEIEELISDFERCLQDDHYASAKQLLAGVVAIVGIEDPEAYYGRALLAWQELENYDEARRLLEHSVTLDPEFADARHALGGLCDLLDDFAGMVEQWSAVLELDTRADEGAGLESPDALEFIAGVAESLFASLPEEFRAPLRNVPIVLEARPHPEIVAEGFDPRALGLFEGTEQAHSAGFEMASSAPTRIVLFTSNLLASFPDEARLEEEIEVTLLHEIGHFFGLDEDQVDALGLG